MRPDEIDLTVEWAAAEGWNPGLHDAACFAAADSAGFLVASLGSEPVAAISAVRYGDGFGFVGFYIVPPQHRGKGYGLAIWNAAMARLTGRNVGLDGVPEQQDNYRRSGFTLAYRNVRFGGAGGGDRPGTPGLVDLATVPFAAVAAYDRPFFPDDRRAFLRRWVTQPGAVALGVMRNGALRGYGVLRPCRDGYKIGPLFADDAVLAESLFLDLRAATGHDDRVVLDVPEPNGAAVALAERHGLAPAFETARMYTGPHPDLPMDRLWGVTTFELG